MIAYEIAHFCRYCSSKWITCQTYPHLVIFVLLKVWYSGECSITWPFLIENWWIDITSPIYLISHCSFFSYEVRRFSVLSNSRFESDYLWGGVTICRWVSYSFGVWIEFYLAGNFEGGLWKGSGKFSAAVMNVFPLSGPTSLFFISELGR